jgi:hypothetical protein
MHAVTESTLLLLQVLRKYKDSHSHVPTETAQWHASFDIQCHHRCHCHVLQQTSMYNSSAVVQDLDIAIRPMYYH